MQKILMGIISVASLTLFQAATIAQEYEGCFMVNARGQVIKLSEMCPDNTQEVTPGETPGVFTVPIKRRDAGIPVVDVTFNGDKTFEMFLDSGASITKITEEMAKALGVVPDGMIETQVASGELLQFPSAQVASIQVGGATVKNVQVSIGKVPLLGQNFFGDYEMTIKKDVVEFRAPIATK